jgi:hypothetical protein
MGRYTFQFGFHMAHTFLETRNIPIPMKGIKSKLELIIQYPMGWMSAPTFIGMGRDDGVLMWCHRFFLITEEGGEID